MFGALLGRFRAPMKDFWHLHGFDWLGELSSAETAQLRDRSVCHAYAPAELIFAPTSHPQSVYLLERGLVRIFRLSPSGSETTFGYVNAGEIFGELAAFADRPRESFAQAVRSSIVWRVAREALQEAITTHPVIVAEVTKQVGARLKRIESRVENLVFRNVRSRVACILLELAEDFGRAHSCGLAIDLPLSQEDLATLVGATRQSVNASLRELRQEGFVTRDRRRFVLTRPEALRLALCEHTP
jgi:CRP/FNR family transcriptional regulator, cyclic AMP receptor protein